MLDRSFDAWSLFEQVEDRKRQEESYAWAVWQERDNAKQHELASRELHAFLSFSQRS